MSGYADPDIKQTSKYLKIESGTPVDLRLLNKEPAETFEHFSPVGSIECKGEMCSACNDGDESQQKFITNVYDFGAQKVRIWKYGATIARQIKEIAITLQEENKNILEVDLKVSATGSNKQKKYTVTPRMTAKPMPADLKLFPLDIPF
jgi:hypothetical protein